MKLILVFCFLCLALAANGQISVSGKVVNAATNTPIPDVSVFINNTSIGTVTDANGAFILNTNYNGRIELVISHTAFQKKVITLTAGPIPVKLTISLEPKTNVLDEVVIVNDPLRGWRKWHRLFTDYFIGTSAFAKKCVIKNPEVLAFHYNRADNELKVSSRSTLIVENRALGYVYKIDLNLFTYSFTTLRLQSDITVFFEHIKPADASEQKQFDANRGIAFRGSKMDFIRALYQKNYNTKGFAVVAIHARPNAEKQRILHMISGARAQAYLENRNVNTVTLASVANGNRDTVAYYDHELSEPDYIIKDTSSAHLDRNIQISTDHNGRLRLPDTLLIQYSDNGGTKSMPFHLPANGGGFTLENLQTDLRSNSAHQLRYTLMTANEITIYPDGSYNGGLFTKGYMDNAKVAGLLPWDYQDKQSLPINGVEADNEIPLSLEANSGEQAVKSLLDKLKAFLTAHPVEKVHLQLDRPWYAAGDTVYFKAYVTTGEQHKLSPMSKILHVDLINANNKVGRSIKLQLNNGIAWGDFALPDSVHNDGYRIRAYTRLIENEAEPAYFERKVPVTVVKNSRITESVISPGIANSQIDIQFFPEGGELVAGIRSKVGFKAVGPNGLGVDVQGIVTDNNGNKVCDFASRHLGMGYFYLEPAPNKSYKAELTYRDSAKIDIDLPKPRSDGLVLSINNDQPGKAIVKVSANKAFYEKNRDNEFSIVVYSGGEAIPAVFRLNELTIAIDIDTHDLHTGVARATLFSSANEPLAERLFFIKNNDLLDLDIHSDKMMYAKRENIRISLHAKNTGLPVDGHFSVSVIDGNQVAFDENSEHTILTDLLLTPDLKGYVEQPNYYFASDAQNAHNDLDLLMLTQGYRRFEWKAVLGSGAAPAFQAETALEVAGTLATLSGKPVPKGKVVFLDGKNGIVRDTITDAGGNFKFDNLDISDTSTVIVSAHKGNNSGDVKVTISQDQPPPVTATDTYRVVVPQQYAVLAQERYQQVKKSSSLSRVINLKTVQISARNNPGTFKLQHSANLNGAGHANYVLVGDQLDNCIDLPCLFGKLPGTISKRGKLYLIRTPEHFGQFSPTYLQPTPPILFILDGVPVPNQNYVYDIVSVHDIYSIELLSSGAYLALYGSAAAGGAVVITTKRGGERSSSPAAASPGLVIFQLNGFYKPRQFYSPRYDHPRDTSPQDIRPTIYWNPEMVPDKDGNLSFDYFNSDMRGTCIVIVEGIDGHGNIGRSVYRYKVE
ncbi:MAG: carboxypeptidase-like regulatory domain-containing protein [Bacteroidetes bacterium]|nr:carboxypeptidase-like regulatory domain-containing protein [Bacteroidota bacterium]